ncbi:MAG: S66 peptidase family protein [Myxococcota bacterium]
MLNPGARIAVVSPSGIFDPARLAQGMALLEAWGYRPTALPGVGKTFRYLAGDDPTRLRDLVAALTGDWDAAWVARGGFGLTRLLPALPLEDVRVPLIGFSDATALLVPMQARGLPGVHGPVLHSLADHCDDASRAHLRALLAGEPLSPMQGRMLRHGVAEGPLVGGNLCMLASACGTPWRLRAKGAIVVLEDVAEPAYKVDRMLTQLVQSDALDGVAGFALGTFLGAAAPEGADWSVLDVIEEKLAPFGVPVIADLPIGHGKENWAWRVGGEARIERGKLVLG